MKKLEHLTQIQILAYTNGSLSTSETHEIGKHLLFCQNCRELLQTPTLRQLQATINTDNGFGVIETQSNKESSGWSIFPDIYLIRAFLKRPIASMALTFSTGAFLIVIGCLFAVWLTSRHNENTIAKLNEIEIPANVPVENIPTPVDPKPNNRTSISASSKNEPRTKKSLKTNPEKPKAGSTVQKLSDKHIANQTSSKIIAKSPNTADVRGKIGKCVEEALFESEFTLKNSKIVFTWKKIPNAKAYHLYISDDNEILIDEFETESETSFVSKMTLDPSKSYKWKIIATLENGQTVVGPSLKVTSKELQNTQIKLEKANKRQIRCSEIN